MAQQGRLEIAIGLERPTFRIDYTDGEGTEISVRANSMVEAMTQFREAAEVNTAAMLALHRRDRQIGQAIQ